MVGFLRQKVIIYENYLCTTVEEKETANDCSQTAHGRYFHRRGGQATRFRALATTRRVVQAPLDILLNAAAVASLLLDQVGLTQEGFI